MKRNSRAASLRKRLAAALLLFALWTSGTAYSSLFFPVFAATENTGTEDKADNGAPTGEKNGGEQKNSGEIEGVRIPREIVLGDLRSRCDRRRRGGLLFCKTKKITALFSGSSEAQRRMPCHFHRTKKSRLPQRCCGRGIRCRRKRKPPLPASAGSAPAGGF